MEEILEVASERRAEPGIGERELDEGADAHGADARRALAVDDRNLRR